MSALTLRRVCRCVQTISARQYIQRPNIRFNSTRDQDPDIDWRKVLPEELGRTKNRVVSVEDMWKRKSDMFLSGFLTGNVSNAYTGRSVEVQDGDVVGAAKVLDKVLAQNNVARDWFTNRRHKQKGEERRKTISLRWRRRFKHEVGKKVELVQQIRRRGA